MAKLSITPDLIPHTDFHKGIWLLPVKGAHWYYFMRKRNRFAITDQDFIDTVDKPLRELVKFFRSKHIKTTPSCSGHHFHRHDFENVYDELLDDMHCIRNGGLELKDIETGKTITYRDAHYTLPWSREEFLKKIMDYQQKGVIGFEAPHNKKLNEQLLHLHIPGATIVEKNSLIFILTDKAKTGTAKLWQRITRSIRSAFRQAELSR